MKMIRMKVRWEVMKMICMMTRGSIIEVQTRFQWQIAAYRLDRWINPHVFYPEEFSAHGD